MRGTLLAAALGLLVGTGAAHLTSPPRELSREEEVVRVRLCKPLPGPDEFALLEDLERGEKFFMKIPASFEDRLGLVVGDVVRCKRIRVRLERGCERLEYPT
jgi:hypothetical protein